MSINMSAPDRKGLDIEAILSDLYASEINASISWIWDGGFQATLGAPPVEEYALPTIRDASCGSGTRPASVSRIANSPGSTAASSEPTATGPKSFVSVATYAARSGPPH